MVMPESPKESALKKQLDRVIWDKWSKGKIAELKPSELGWTQDAMPWKAEFQLNAASDQPFLYRAEGKYISFKPTGLWWVTPQGPSVIKQGVSSSIGTKTDGKVRYANALGVGISLEASISRTRWRKEVTIDSLASLGAIPADAEFLGIGFEIETDFDVEGWDKKSELQFNTAIKLSELSQLESIKTRDNHIIPEPKEDEEPEDPFERCDSFLRVADGKYFLVKRIPADYLRDAVYPVTTDVEIAYGAEYTFHAHWTLHISCAALDSTHFVVGYRDQWATGEPGRSRIGVVTGTTIAYGSVNTFNADDTTYISCARLDATHFVIGFVDEADRGKCRIGVVTGNAITYGSVNTFNTYTTTSVSCAALDDTHFVVGYRNRPNNGKCRIGVVTGDAIAYGSEYTFNAVDITDTSCAALDDTHFVVAFMDYGGASHGIARIGVVSSGDQIAYGLEYAFNAATTNYISCAALDDTHFVVAFRDDADADKGKCMIGVVTGDAIAYGAEYTFNAVATNIISCAALDSTHFVVGFRDYGGAKHGISRIGVVTGTTIAYGSEYTFNATDTRYISWAVLDDTHFVVAFNDSGGDEYGIARIGTYTPPPEVGLENKSANMGSKMVAAGLI